MPSLPLPPSSLRPFNSRELEIYTEWSDYRERWIRLSRDLDEMLAFYSDFRTLEKPEEPVPEVKWEKCEVNEGYELINGKLKRKNT